MPKVALYQCKENAFVISLNQTLTHYRRSLVVRVEIGLEVAKSHPCALPGVIIISRAINRLASDLGLEDLCLMFTVCVGDSN